MKKLIVSLKSPSVALDDFKKKYKAASKMKLNSTHYEISFDKDQSNLNKLITFFEYYGIVRIIDEKVSGRTVKKPVVDYKKIEFDLAA